MLHKTKLVTAFVFMAAMATTGTAFADRASDTETLFNWAEKNFPQYFPSHDTTKPFSPWAFRFYVQTGIYLGLNDNNGVYVLGGAFGNSPYYIDTLANLLKLAIPPTSGGGAACDTSQAPAGFSYTQSGNTVNVTTNGRCVVPPTTALCNAAAAAQATGVSVLGNVTVNTFTMSGFKILIPGFPNPFDSVAKGIANGKSCIRNAPAQGYSSLVVNVDTCYDLTSTLGTSAKSIPGVLEVTPPVTMAVKEQIVNQAVNDCFATDATTVFDAFTQEAWIKQNGAFVKIK
jgi:hypothetical protein